MRFKLKFKDHRYKQVTRRKKVSQIAYSARYLTWKIKHGKLNSMALHVLTPVVTSRYCLLSFSCKRELDVSTFLYTAYHEKSLSLALSLE